MLSVANNQHPLARPFAHYEFESGNAGIGGDERHRAIVIFSRSYLALPLADIECGAVKLAPPGVTLGVAV